MRVVRFNVKRLVVLAAVLLLAIQASLYFFTERVHKSSSRSVSSTGPIDSFEENLRAVSLHEGS